MGQERVERRKQERFQVPKGAFVALKSNDIRVGPVVDVSPCGLGFRYIPRNLPSAGPCELQVFVGDNVYSYELPFETVFDAEVSGDVNMRRCGVKLGEAEQNGILNIENLIRKHRAERAL